MELKVLTVSKLNEYINSYIGVNPILQSLSVEGEISNLRKTNYGYTFFSLKDENCKIDAIIFQNIQSLDFEDGDYVVITGRVNLYKKYGNLSLVADNVEKKGQGLNYEKFKKLYKKLEEKGYFKEENKKAIPKFPNKIAIITSLKGAAVKDIISVIKRRYPIVTLYLINAKMQGEDAVESILEAVEKVKKLDTDTVILSRGGGDKDDLFVFNDERIIEAVREIKKPLISAIGHEIDYVILDYVADLRAATPSIAGELSVPNLENLLATAKFNENYIRKRYKDILKINKSRVLNLKYQINLNSPSQRLINKKILLNNLKTSIKLMYIKKLSLKRDYILMLKSKISLNNYEEILKKGFALIKKDEKYLKDGKNLKKGDIIEISLGTNTIKAQVQEVN